MPLPRLNVPSLASAAKLAIVTANVPDARVGGGKSFGSRGTKTYTAPPATKTAAGAAPIECSMTDRPASTTASAAQPLRVDGWSGLLTGGVIAASLGTIFGFGAIVRILGFLLQFALIGAAIYLVMNFIRSRNQPAPAPGRGAGETRRDTPNRSSYIFRHGPSALASALPIGKEDFDCFERLLGEIQAAYGRRDIDALGARTTPEMLSHFSQELHDNASQGERHAASEITLLQGDLSEAWHEDGSDYATVAMRYSLVDVTAERTGGPLISSDTTGSSEVIELWTFRRDDRARAHGWELSAIQQAA
jgi:predicted lipid-binding transport protein (Tim44 family)